MSKINKIINDIQFNEIKLKINNIIPNLNQNEFENLMIYYHDLLNFIAIKFNITSDIFYNRLKYNNYSDAYSIFNMLLPYINNELGDYNNHKNIFNLKDISLNTNVTKIQYSRSLTFNNNNDTYDNKIYYKKKFINNNEYYYEYEYNFNDIEINFKLLLKTIERISNKLYIEWINILPITIKNYKNTNLYINTINYYKNNDIKLDNFINIINDITYIEDNINYNGLYIGDIYNVIYKNLYYDIIHAKWLLYEKNYQTLYGLMFKIISIDNINRIYNVDINLLNHEELENIKYEFKNFINEIKKINQDWLYQFLLFFEYEFEYISDLKKKGYISMFNNLEDNKFKNNKLNYIENIDLNTKYKNDIDIEKNLNCIDFNYIYIYLKKLFLKFSKTWYGKNILKFDNNKIIGCNEFYNIERKITFKNIYNYAKCLISDINNNIININEIENKQIIKLMKKELLNGYIIWDGLDNNKKYNFIEKLINNKKNYYKWFNIKKIYTKIFDDFNIKDYNNYITNINNYLYNNIIDIIFESMIFDGLLSELNFNNNELYDKNKFQSDIEYKKNMMKNILYEDNKFKYDDYIYYLNKEKIIDMYIDLDKKIKYIDEIINNQKWMTLYSFDWINQINFYHHFINNRVLMVSAGTGQGKSTQVPKLIYYGYNIIYYKNTRIICTQPRIQPVLNNSKYVSYELGVPILYKINNNEDLKNNNGYIQYTTKIQKHIVINQSNHINYSTDGILYEKLSKNLLFKKYINNSELDNQNNMNIMLIWI